ncbi:hypothetical protein Dimus_028601 [Dionaea muscipula]
MGGCSGSEEFCGAEPRAGFGQLPPNLLPLLRVRPIKLLRQRHHFQILIRCCHASGKQPRGPSYAVSANLGPLLTVFPPNVPGGPGYGAGPQYMPPPRQLDNYYLPADMPDRQTH